LVILRQNDRIKVAFSVGGLSPRRFVLSLGSVIDGVLGLISIGGRTRSALCRALVVELAAL